MAKDTSLKRRLSAHDSVFLYWEHPEQPFHVAEVMVYEGRFNAADLVKMIEARIHLLPRYRQRLVFAPLGIVHPSWADDPDFEVSHHVDELELPAPGDDRVLARLTGELFGELLDRRRPLWQATVMHGHSGGGTIVFLKLHHAMVDGVSSIDLIEILHETDPATGPPDPPEEQWRPGPLPGPLSVLANGVADAGAGLRDVVSLLKPNAALDLARRLRVLARTLTNTAPMALLPPPPTPFNRPISPSREIAWIEFPLDEVASVRKRLGATVNDMVLAILSGALGRYMRRHGYETEGVVLRAMCPVSVRRADQHGAMGNLVSMVVAPLHVGVADPVQRLRAGREAMQRLKEEDQAGGIHDLIALAERLPAPLFAAPWRFGPRGRWSQNIVSTNVRGPSAPLFLDGHELRHWYPFAVQWHDLGFVLCTLSYREHLTLGLVADPTVAPDVWDAVDDMNASYEELKAASTTLRRRPRQREGQGMAR